MQYKKRKKRLNGLILFKPGTVHLDTYNTDTPITLNRLIFFFYILYYFDAISL